MCIYIYIYIYIYRFIQNDCRGFNNLSYTTHLRWKYMYFFISYSKTPSFCYIPYRYVCMRIFRSVGATTYSYLKYIAYDTFEIGVCVSTDISRNSQRTPVMNVTKTWSFVLLNKKIHTLLSQVYCV